MHNDGTRITYVRRGMCSYTFQLPGEDDIIKTKATLMYYIEDDDTSIFTRQNGDTQEIYIKTGIQAKHTDENSGIDNPCYTNATQLLYNVSEIVE